MGEIIIHIIGTDGLLDLSEGDYTVRNLIDTAERAKELILTEGEGYSNYGWSVISATKRNEAEPICHCPITHRITGTHIKGCEAGNTDE